jgi:uncharacterized protein YdgA (DUF945 family)
VVYLLVALAVLLLVSPGVIGLITERSLEESIEQVGIETPEITISTENFKRGWFTSVGRHRIELSDRARFPELANFVDQAGYTGMPALILESYIDHGVVPLSLDDGSLQPGIAKLSSTIQLDPGNGELIDLPGRIHSRINFSGTTEADLLIEKGSFSDGDAQIDWQGAAIRMTLNSDGIMTAVDGFIAPIRFRAGQQEVAANRIDISLVQDLSDYNFMVGSMQASSAGVSIADEAGNRIGFASMNVRASNDIDAGRLSGASEFDVSGIMTPSLGTVNLSLDMEYSGFDAASFVVLYSALKETAADGRPEDVFAAIYPSMDAEIQQFLSAGADVKVNNLKIGLPLGDILADFHFSLPEAGPGDTFSWPGLLLKLKASINLKLPMALFQMIEAVQPEAGSAVAMGILVLDGNQYKMQLEYAQGLATINGIPMAVPLPGT